MEIKTKFNLGESVWGVLEGRAHGFEIVEIEIEKGKNGNYCIAYRDNGYNVYPESQCFIAKEELRDYFMAGE